MKNWMKKVMMLVLVATAVFSMAVNASAAGIGESAMLESLYDDMAAQGVDIGDLMPSGFGNLISGGFTVFGIFFALIFTFVICGFALAFASNRKSRKLDQVMQNISLDPCEATAEAAIDEFTHINKLVRFNLSSGGDKSGVHFTMWREVFNNYVIPCRTIKPATKETLRQALIKLNTHSLRPVAHTQTPQEAKVAAEVFGQGGEDQVWHNLKFLQGCDVYRNVRISNGCTTSEIDAVIVDAAKGVFLLETKSAGGEKAPDGTRIVSYHQLSDEPSNQIYRHESDFLSAFAGLGVENKIKNVLVFSWPKGDARRVLDRSSLPQADFDIITVEELMRYHRTQPENLLSDAQRNALAEKLRSCSGEYVIR